MTTTIENGFGSRLMVRGFLLNNELDGFLLPQPRDGRAHGQPGGAGQAAALVHGADHRDADGAPVLVVGSPGGSRIIGYVAKTILAHIDWGMDVQQAVALPHLVNRCDRAVTLPAVGAGRPCRRAARVFRLRRRFCAFLCRLSRENSRAFSDDPRNPFREGVAQS